MFLTIIKILLLVFKKMSTASLLWDMMEKHNKHLTKNQRMDKQLSLFDEILKTEGKEYENSRNALRIVRTLKYLKSKVESVEGVDNPYHVNNNKVIGLSGDVSEALYRSWGIFYLVSSNLPEFKGKTLNEVIDIIDVIPYFGPSKVITLDEAYDTSRSMRKSLRIELNSLHEDFKTTERSPDLRFHFNYHKNNILRCLKK